MAEEQQDSVLEGRPTSRRGKGKARAENNEEAGLSIFQEDAGGAEASTSRTERSEQQTKERKKPRKLERRSVQLEEPVTTLDTRVERLERQFQALSSRMDAVEVRQVRRPTASSYRRSSSASTRATSGAARPRTRTAAPRPTSNTIRPSLADQLRESQRLRKTAQRHRSAENIEEVPRNPLTATASQSRQVALTGKYNIPLPSNLTTEDILNLKSGLTAAGSIARSLAGVLTSSHDAGSGSGTATPRGPATATTAAPAGRSRSTVPPSSPTVDRGQNNKDVAEDSTGGNPTSSAPAGNRQPEVAGAAKDAAVEIHTDPPSSDMAAGNAGGYQTPARVGRGMRRRNVSPVVRGGDGAGSKVGSSRGSITQHRPAPSRRSTASSRASSLV